AESLPPVAGSPRASCGSCHRSREGCGPHVAPVLCEGRRKFRSSAVSGGVRSHDGSYAAPHADAIHVVEIVNRTDVADVLQPPRMTASDLPAVALAAVPGRRRATLELARDIEHRGFSGIYCASFGD